MKVIAACAFTPDSMFVVTAAEMEPASAPAVAPTATAPLPGSELALWQWDAARIVARISVPGERVTRALCASEAGGVPGHCLARRLEGTRADVPVSAVRVMLLRLL